MIISRDEKLKNAVTKLLFNRYEIDGKIIKGQSVNRLLTILRSDGFVISKGTEYFLGKLKGLGFIVQDANIEGTKKIARIVYF